jgi:hypothetical protein
MCACLIKTARPEGTYVALDVCYKYEEIAEVSSGVRKRAADALAVSTDAAAKLMAGMYVEELAEEDAMLVAVGVIEELKREEAEARRRALEEEERNSTEYFFIQVVSGANLPAGSSGFVKVVVGNHEPHCTMVVWGEEPFWGEGFATLIPKTLSSRSATISLFDDRSVVGQVRLHSLAPALRSAHPQNGRFHPANVLMNAHMPGCSDTEKAQL